MIIRPNERIRQKRAPNRYRQMRMKKLISAFLVLSFGIVSISARATTNQTIIKTPQEAANGLYQAWSIKNKTRAQKFGRAEAVDKLFGVRRQKMTFKGCTKRADEGDYECLYENKKLDLTMAMIVKIFRVGYKVTELSFSSEAI